MGAPPRVALVGVHGFGRVHLDRLVRIAGEGRIAIAALVDERPPDAASIDAVRATAGGAGVVIGQDAATVLTATRPDVTIVSTPIHTHLPLAEQALAAGSHLFLEKPPTATLAGFDTLAAQVELAGRVCQVGFQAFGSAALDHAAGLIARGELGRIRGVGVHGAWVREVSYFERAPWAGRMRLGDTPVTDGALTNAYAHAVAAALRVLGTPDDVELGVELERYRAMSPEGDDTAAARITVAGVPVVIAVTLCARTARDPVLVVHGEHGRLELGYTADRLTGHTSAGAVAAPAGRTDLLENLLDHLADPSIPLVSPLSASRPFMQVLEAVRIDGPARPVPASALTTDGGRPVVEGVDEIVRECAERLALFSELPAPWPADQEVPR
ncbi:Gfo/Idh/MocA family protein [Pseudonocardia sp. TRM90224]|uniref:Gfo/Idh/MocA family protein n=1 Tax=Pseudonocardia sp. TRM90224 TaxID=2812678 RepID=UPI001E44454D|nr:Gfo/Idh/MocA family oxidoreductase [Pseudonocardia sp. TRM90224]